MQKHSDLRQRIDRMTSPSLRSWEKPPMPAIRKMKANTAVEMGWGRIIFGQTFEGGSQVFRTLCQEAAGTRDIAFYLRDPHVVLSYAPDKLFLDPSHTYRLWSHDYRHDPKPLQVFNVRRITTVEDAAAVNRIYSARGMVQCPEEFMLNRFAERLRTYLVAEHAGNGNRIVGTVSGVDHVEAFNDPEDGASLWCLAVDPQAVMPGVGEALVRQLVEHYFARGRNYVDLSVMHDNTEAIKLYEKIGFQRVPVFCVKRKNPINEPLFTAKDPAASLNPYARIIVKEAMRRGIEVSVVDEDFGIFRLTSGGQSIVCRESLTELTSAIAMTRCDDKRITHRTLHAAGLKVPRQFEAGDADENRRILEELGRVVVKPARGEQGDGISIDIQTPDEIVEAVRIARRYCPDVIVEALVEGEDLRVIVIDYTVVAAAIRKPPVIVGDGGTTIQGLLEKYNRRRKAATGGESHVPFDTETERCLRMQGYAYDAVLPAGENITVRKTANLHTGGTITDVTARLHPALRSAAEKAARALEIPVTGLDFFVKDVTAPDYFIIEANERPGLANHEPQPAAERFIDLLFPRTAPI